MSRSLTESEVIGIYDALPQMLWIKMFLEAQGVGVKEAIAYQDNMNSILLEKDRKLSSTK